MSWNPPLGWTPDNKCWHLSCIGKDTMCPAGDIDRDLCSAQFCESLGVQDQEESAFLLHAGPDMGNVTNVSLSHYFLTIFVSGVTPLWLILQGCTCFSGRDYDWQDHSIIFLDSTGRCNKDRLRRVQAGVTPHLSRKESGYASYPADFSDAGTRMEFWCDVL